MSKFDEILSGASAPRSLAFSPPSGGADVRPDFNWDKKPVGRMGYR
jgi:hypothetical protein